MCLILLADASVVFAYPLIAAEHAAVVHAVIIVSIVLTVLVVLIAAALSHCTLADASAFIQKSISITWSVAGRHWYVSSVADIFATVSASKPSVTPPESRTTTPFLGAGVVSHGSRGTNRRQTAVHDGLVRCMRRQIEGFRSNAVTSISVQTKK